MSEVNKNEADILALYFKETLKIVETLIITVKNQTAVMASVSSKLAAVNEQLTSGTGENANQSNIVTSAMKQISANMNTVAAATEEMSRNVSYLKSMVSRFSPS